MISLTTILITIAIGAVFLIFNRGKRAKLPPGPLSLPIIGSLISFGKQPFKKFLLWGEKYEKMFSLGFGPEQCIVVNDLKLAREIFNDLRFSGRPFVQAMNLGSRGKHGVINSEGQEWVEQRRFMLRHLRDFGFGKKTMEALIMEDVNEFINELKKVEGQPVPDMIRRFNLTVINSLWTIISGKRHSYKDEVITDILSNFTKVKESFSLLSFLVPRIAKLVPKLSGWVILEDIINMERKMVFDKIKEHQDKPPEDGVARDFMDSYLSEVKTTTDPSSSFYKEKGIQSLVAVALDLFNAGTDTTSTTLGWAILYVAKLQDVQKKLQNELDTVVGRNRQISVADRSSLPYAEALFLEILRYSSIVVFGVFHTTMEDIPDFHGYDLPKGTWITANLYYIHHSTKHWDEPEVFKPERFISEDGKTVKRPDAFMPFSSGKRACPGETLARDEIFLFVTNIFHRFNVRLSDECKNVSLEHKPGVGSEPYHYSVIFEDRL